VGLAKFIRRQSARLGSVRQFYCERRRRGRDRDARADRANQASGENKTWNRIRNRSSNRGRRRLMSPSRTGTMKRELPKKIAVLMGGPGSERDVSLATGRGVSKALRSLGIDVVDIDVRDENFLLPEDVDLAFITIHGTFGEDGQLQKILEDRGVAYTGDGVEESLIAFDKILTKEKFREHNVVTPEWEVVDAGQRPTIAVPLVVKPA